MQTADLEEMGSFEESLVFNDLLVQEAFSPADISGDPVLATLVHSG